MFFRGVEIVFPVYFCKDGEEDRLYSIYDTAEEAVEAVKRLKPEIKEGETLWIRNGEVVGDRDHLTFWIDGYECYDSLKLNKSLIKEIERSSRVMIPAQAFTPVNRLPYARRRACGKKKKPLEAYKYVCMDCGELNGKCNCIGYFKRYGINAKVREFEKPDGYKLRTEEELERDVLACPWCWHAVDQCVCEKWPEYLYRIDTNILPVIRAFNTKGYVTSYCCEGHGINDGIYIKFRVHYNFRNPLPEGWYADAHNTICTYFDEKSPEPFEDQKQRKLQEMLEWIETIRTIDRFDWS